MGNCGEFHTFTVAYYNKVMIRFLGNIEARADAKGRVFIPATFRKQLQIASEERLIMRKDVFQDCLTLYPESVWNEELNELRSRLNKWNNKHQLIFRKFVSDDEVVTPDSSIFAFSAASFRRCIATLSVVKSMPLVFWNSAAR